MNTSRLALIKRIHKANSFNGGNFDCQIDTSKEVKDMGFDLSHKSDFDEWEAEEMANMPSNLANMFDQASY